MKQLMMAGLVMAMAWSGAAPAQDVAAAAASAAEPVQVQSPVQPSAPDNGALADIVVTAQRRAENLQDVPIAVTALTSAELKASGIVATSDLAKVTPGLVVANTAGLSRPSLRGVTTTSAGPGIENSIATYIDGVYIASIPGSLLGLGGVERIEVLRGPQGTLFGRNATGGLIQVVTKDPSRTLEGEANLGYGAYNTVSGNFYVAGPITDGVSASLAFTGTHQGDGYGVNFTTGHDTNQVKHDIAARGKLLVDLGADTVARLSVDYSNRLSSSPLVGALRGRPALYGPIHEGSAWDIDQDIDPRHRLSNGGISLRVDQKIGTLNLVSITAYRALDFRQLYDFDTGPKPAVTIDYADKDHQFSQELQLQSGKGPFTWVVGSYYFNASAKYTPYIQYRNAPLAPGSTVTNSNITTDSLAGFAQASYKFGSGTELTAGVRYTTEKRGVTGTTETFSGTGSSLGLAFAPINADKRFNKLTWRLAASQKLSDRTLLYASYNRGFKAGSFNGQAPNLPAFNPEVLDAYEAGLKTDLLDRHLRVNIAGFYYDYKDIQVTTFVNGSSRIYNGARSRQYGLDVDLTAVVTHNLNLTASAEAIHDRFTSFPSAVIGQLQPNGSNVLTPGSANGNRLPYTADLTASVGAHYEHSVAFGKVELNVDYLYNNGYFTEPDNVLHQSRYHQLGAAAVLTSMHGYTLTIWGRNLLNEAIATLLATTPSSTLAGYQSPRTYGATVGVTF